MRKNLTRIVLAALALVTLPVLALTPTFAQDDAPVACDSTLITLVFLAEHHYGYKPNIAMGDMVVHFDYGQFAPWFDAMMAMMKDDTMMGDDTMMESDAMMDEGMMDDMAALKPGHVEGENEYCADLRVGVEEFLYKAISAEMMAMSEGS